MRNAPFISLMLFAAAIPVKADQPTVTAQSTAQFGALRPAQKNPYAKLFEARDALKQALQQVAQDAPKSKTVCGMTIIEADPLFDAKMRVTPPKDANLRYTIRAVDPPVCNPARK
jgi:hypothetical protein